MSKAEARRIWNQHGGAGLAGAPNPRSGAGGAPWRSAAGPWFDPGRATVEAQQYISTAESTVITEVLAFRLI